MKYTQKTPYTDNNNRLADVIAAIQVMATYKFYKLDFSGWADRIEGNPSNASYWKSVFQQHPEFFRLDSYQERASLVWRRNYQKLYDVDGEKKISRADFNALSNIQKLRISRTPLTNSDISTLITTAINLHGSELESKKDSRWWISGAIGLAGVVVGAAINSFDG